MLGALDNIVYNYPFAVVGFYVLLYIAFGSIDTIVYLKNIPYAYNIVNGIFYAILTLSFDFTFHRYELSYWTTTLWLLIAIAYACSTPWTFIIKKKKRKEGIEK